jgi:hypothetical protein
VDHNRKLGVSLATLRKALDALQAEHVIVREPGRATFVRSRETARAYERFNPTKGNDGGLARAEDKVGVLAVPSQVATPSPSPRASSRCLERVAFGTDDKPVEVMTA